MDASLSTKNMFEYNYVNDYLMNPVVFLIVFVIVVIYVIFFSSLGNSEKSMSTNFESNSNSDYTQIIWFILFFVILVLVVQYLIQYGYNIDAVAYIKNFFGSNPEVVIEVDDKNKGLLVPKIDHPEAKPQVFNIPGNHYNYENAKAVCKAYGARLAKYDEVEDAYNNGGEWCNYGWSENQMALFPTQKATYDELQKKKGHEHNCGRPGVNGGYIDNANIKFGVNCYGIKPGMSKEEEELMMVQSPIQETVEDVQFQKQVDYWKSQLPNILVAPFNYNSWNRL